jgi:hypothetical protein
LPKGVLLLGDCLFQSRPFQQKLAVTKSNEKDVENKKFTVEIPPWNTEETVKISETNHSGIQKKISLTFVPKQQQKKKILP